MKARDGLQLHGYVTRPAGDGPHAMVVMPHGGPYGVRDSWEFEPEVQLLANRGYAVLQINFRGSGGYSMDFQRAGYREWGGKMQDDLTDATRWAIEQKIAPADRICIYGASYGGYAALMGAVARARSVSLRHRLRRRLRPGADLESGDIPDSSWGRAYLQRTLGNDVANLRAHSPVYNAQSIKAPVLLIHGKVGRARRVRARAAHEGRAGKEPEESRVPGARPRRPRHLRRGVASRGLRTDPAVPGHESQDGAVDGVSIANERVLAFLAKNLPAGATLR